MDLPVRSHPVYSFGRFRLDPVRRGLLRDASPIALPPRLFDTLLYLVENAGRVVEHDELLRAVWAGRVVEDANIKQTIFSLRKVLQADGAADRFIVTAPMRGYRFTGPVHVEFERQSPPMRDMSAARVAPAGPLWRGLSVAAAGLSCLSVAVWFWLGKPPPPPPHSVAVMAFTDLDGGGARDYFSEGLSAELISALGRIEGLHVAARSSAFAFKGKTARLADIARQLNVGAILEGSVRRIGGRLRLTVDLIDVASGFALWSHSYERNGGDVLQAQEEIAASVAGALQVTLLHDAAERLAIGGSSDPRAFDLYLHGMALLDGAAASAPEFGNALAAFDQAIAIDPRFALARAHRAHVLTLIADSGGADQGAGGSKLTEARAEAERAIAIAPGLAGGHLARGSVLLATQDFAGADREISLARDLAPGDATILLSYADMQVSFGRVAEGVKAAEQAASLDPLTPGTYITLAGVLVDAGQYDAALAAMRRARILGVRCGRA